MKTQNGNPAKRGISLLLAILMLLSLMPVSVLAEETDTKPYAANEQMGLESGQEPEAEPEPSDNASLDENNPLDPADTDLVFAAAVGASADYTLDGGAVITVREDSLNDDNSTDGTITAYAFDESITELVIPEYVLRNPAEEDTAANRIYITIILSNAFGYYSAANAPGRALRKITLPKKLELLGEYESLSTTTGAFSFCTALEEVIFPESDTPLFIGSGAFRNCT